MRIYTVATTSILMACADLAGCGKTEERLPPEVTTAITHDFNQGDAIRAAENYADDAQILPPRRPVIEGKSAIAAFWKANIDKSLSLGNYTAWSVVRGDMGIEQGVYSVRNVQVGENVESGKYVRIWKKTNGAWKLYRDMFSSDSEPSGAVSVSPDEPTSGESPAKK